VVNQLTIRGFDDELRARLEALARERGISLNKAALLLMQRGAGLEVEGRAANVIGDALDDFIGSWIREDENEILRSIEVLEQVDRELWR
jgi:hypothetical protein